LQLHERSQEFIGAHDETLPVVAVCVCNPDRSPVTIDPMEESDSSVTFRGLRT